MSRLLRRRLVLAGLLLVTAACSGPSVPVQDALEVLEIKTGYDNGGRAAGQNRLLPAITFKVRNRSSGSVRSVQFNAVFRVVGDTEELGAQLVRGIDWSGLGAGGTAGPYVLRSTFGYSGEQARGQMFQHDGFKDVQVELFAKQGGAQWVKLNDQVVDRQLLAIAPSTAAK
ncbi:MAG: hypothetical protein ACR2LU_13285 [Luteitalea sp.]|nr:hypothetical protein [Acidobacteriota bacterium]